MAWDPGAGHVAAFRDYCWYDWDAVLASTRNLLKHEFQWILPGHGHPIRLPVAAMRTEIEQLLTREGNR
jgi:glyoxylase-like metal-dependent hydrolase (beta-lactamase superfamily II)